MLDNITAVTSRNVKWKNQNARLIRMQEIFPMWCCISPLTSKLRGTAADLKDCSRNSIRCSLTLPVELERVSPEPAGPPRAALGLGELPPLADA